MILGSRENLSMRWHHPLYYKYGALVWIQKCWLVSLFRHIVVLVYILSIGIKSLMILRAWKHDSSFPWICMIVALLPIPKHCRSIIFGMHNHQNKEIHSWDIVWTRFKLWHVFYINVQNLQCIKNWIRQFFFFWVMF